MTKITSRMVDEAISGFTGIAETSGKLAKAKRLALLKDNVVAQKLFALALGPEQFYIKPPKLSEVARASASEEPAALRVIYSDFLKLTTELSGNIITGNAARRAVLLFFGSCWHDDARRWFHAVLEKKLRMGVETAIEDVWPGLIPVFSVPKGKALIRQQTQEIDPLVFKRLKFPCVSQPKKDGYAGPFKVDLKAETCVALTSDGMELPALKGYCQVILRACLDLEIDPVFGDVFFVDGEIESEYGKREADMRWASSWGKTGALVKAGIKRKGFSAESITPEIRGMIADDIRITLYDAYPERALHEPVKIRYSKRRALCKAVVREAQAFTIGKNISLIAQAPCKNWEEAQAQHQIWVEEHKAEGSIYRMDDTPIYAAGNRWRYNYIKQKDYANVDAVILGIEEGTGRNAGTAGAFICWMPERKAITKSTVLGDALKRWVWHNKTALIGYNVEITMDAGNTGAVAVARNPVSRFRDDQQPVVGKDLLAMFKAAKVEPPKSIPTMPFRSFYKELAALAK